MAKREKIMIVLALAALIYTVIYFIFPSAGRNGGKGPGNSPEELNKFVTETIQKTTSAQPTELDLYVAAVAESGWKNNPFLESGSPILSESSELDKGSAKDNSEKKTVGITYTGFVKSVDKKLAIINDFEYEEGEVLTIEKNVFRIVSITQEKVLIEEEKGIEQGRKNQISLPLEETYMLQLRQPEPNNPEF